jgi:DNA-directed RNA polymerase I subunit RPA2
MIQKLLALVAGDCVPDNPDSPMNHEILLPGHLIQMFLKANHTPLLLFLFFSFSSIITILTIHIS